MGFATLPPEVNSGRMYLGPGAGPMLAAAAAWDGLAAELYSTAADYGSVIAELTDVWSGPASAAMTAAAAPYATWLHATATRAEQTAIQAKAAVAAYEAAFAMTVPPPVVAANRAQLMTLIATNFFGHNLPAIAATEAHYAEMWAQDAAAMYGYADAGMLASRLTAFDSPPATAASGAQAGQAAAVAHAAGTGVVDSGLPAPVLPAASPGAATSGLSQFKAVLAHLFGASSDSSLSEDGKLLASLYKNNLSIPYHHLGDFEHMMKIFGALAPAQTLSKSAEAVAGAPTLGAVLGGGGSGSVASVSANVGKAGLIGTLSVPTGWTAVAPNATFAHSASPLTGAGTDAGAVSKTDGLLRGLPLTGAGRRSEGGFSYRYGLRHGVIPRPVAGG